MSFSKIGDIIRSEKLFGDVLKATFDYKVSETKATMNYTGPIMKPEVWYQATSFLQWVFETTHSEGQVRFFLDPEKKEWLSWAFPQEARTGMTAQEIKGPEFDKQRAALPNSEKLAFFGTVHSHCNCSAFQSGTDSNGTGNKDGEKDQDGIHITIGKMSEKMYDFHGRFYLSKVEFPAKMELFWDVGEIIKRMVPSGMLDQVARFQMCQKVPTDFPEQWKQNLIEIKPSYTVGGDYDWRTRSAYQGGLGYCAGGLGVDTSAPEQIRLQEAIETAIEDSLGCCHTLSELRKTSATLWHCTFLDKIHDAATLYKVSAYEMIREMYVNDKAYFTETSSPSGKKESKKERKARIKAENEAKAATYKNTEPDDGNPENWEVCEYMEESGKTAYFQVESPLRYVKTKFNTEAEAMVELSAQIKAVAEKRGATVPLKLADPWKPTHKIGDVPVVFDMPKGKYVRRDGWLWDFEEKAWVSPEGNLKIRADVGTTVSALAATPAANQGTGAHWDEKAKAWMDVDGNPIHKMPK